MPATTQTARKLRRDQTDAEKKLWSRLRNRNLDGLKFKRQVVIEGFVVDFACWDARIIVEADGGQHNEQIAMDDERTKVLESAGFIVLRFWNNEVLSNIDGVLEVTLAAVVSARRNPSPQPSPQGRGSAGTGTIVR
jgi:UDP-N-acetyl-alpha-D-muramoyl-L-alanyl-L-glutamate epimerase